MASGVPLSIDWYDTPRWYDMVFAADTRREADFMEEMLRRHGPGAPSGLVAGGKRRDGPGRLAGVRVLEPACGSGRLVIEMARRGGAVTGFDKSPAMLGYAERRIEARRAALRRAASSGMGANGLVARVVEGDMRAFRFDARFELAHCLVSTFKYLLDEQSAREHLACVARHLVPGGLYVLGFHLTDYAEWRVTQERWVGVSRGTRVTCTTRVWPADRRKRLEDVRTRLVVERAGGKMRTETRWKFRTYDAAQVRRLFRSVPEMEQVALHDFHYDAERPRDLDDGGLDCVFVLRKRGRRSGRLREAE